MTPHASFLAMMGERGAPPNLVRVEGDLPDYGEGGFFDAVNVDTGTSPVATCPWTRPS